ncbi:hypothetical protein COV82_04070 [Candidatus Peregrinibacteria bacterium CG11_big_fil_rev_8_21_14_0_20_46_8]|nr:MAG: hypothetical protein COV82_04070 [Candidatus Peregrinibacteria bacterium CG11_big_fil_rev_8_21_14_0_20_46_8]
MGALRQPAWICPWNRVARGDGAELCGRLRAHGCGDNREQKTKETDMKRLSNWLMSLDENTMVGAVMADWVGIGFVIYMWWSKKKAA